MSFNFPKDFSNFDSEAKQATDNFNSSLKWIVAGSIISGIVATVAIVAVIYVLIDCLKKTGNSFLRYKGIPTDEFDEINAQKVQSDIEMSRSRSQSQSQPVVTNSQVESATMERFICEIANEKPIRFSSEQLDGFTNNYSTILGSGGYGVVFKGAFPNGIPVAVKVLTESNDKRIEEQFMAEVNTIGRTYHINLVRLYGFCFEPNMRALVYEFLENGSLDKLLFENNSREIVEWEKLRDIAIGIAKGIAYLHEECRKKIIHYDIKPENILLDGDLRPKVADFGLAKLCNVEISKMTMASRRGTPGYAAPEMWDPLTPVSHKCDVYSFGIVLFEILGRRRHHDANVEQESRQWLPRWTWEAFSNNELPVMFSLCGIEEKNREKALRMALTALWCVQKTAESRPSMSCVVKMLEEGMEIEQPPNPFNHLKRIEPNSPRFQSDDDWSSHASSYTRSFPEPTPRANLEIELT